MECIHELDLAWCAICRHPEERPSRKPARRPRPAKLTTARRAKPDPVSGAVVEMFAGKRCSLCGHQRIGNFGIDGENPRAGMCRCERLTRYEKDRQEILEWANGLNTRNVKAARWPAMQALRRLAIETGRYEPSEFMGESMPLIARTGLEGRHHFEEPARWSPSRGGGVADDLPVIGG